jgi:hypothetical protein
VLPTTTPISHSATAPFPSLSTATYCIPRDIRTSLFALCVNQTWLHGVDPSMHCRWITLRPSTYICEKFDRLLHHALPWFPLGPEWLRVIMKAVTSWEVRPHHRPSPYIVRATDELSCLFTDQSEENSAESKSMVSSACIPHKCFVGFG